MQHGLRLFISKRYPAVREGPRVQGVVELMGGIKKERVGEECLQKKIVTT